VDLAITSHDSEGHIRLFYSQGSSNPATLSEGAADMTINGIYALADVISGDFNADGRTDIASVTREYDGIYYEKARIFYNDGSYPSSEDSADVIITSQEIDPYNPPKLIAGDFNSDGKTDLVLGAASYSNSAGRVYIFYSQNGQINTNKSIAGEATNNIFGYVMSSGDFNADGRIDLAVGAYGYDPGAAANTGRVYVFYNDGSYSTTAATADAIITGETGGNYFGSSLAAGDMNRDGKTDLLVSAPNYLGDFGRVYIFYNGSITTKNATDSEYKITGGSGIYLGMPLVLADLNNDGWKDIAVTGLGYDGIRGRVYIFYNDVSIPTAYTSADATLTGENYADFFGGSMTSGDFNADGKIDTAVSAFGYSGSTGRAYIFYQPSGGYAGDTGGGSASDIITGESGSYSFGGQMDESQQAMASGDFNADGKADIVIGAPRYGGNVGRAYIFYQNSGGGFTVSLAANADVKIDGTGAFLGTSLAAGDFNADGKIDLAIGEYRASNQAGNNSAGRAFIFYNDGSYATIDTDADVKLDGDAESDHFGFSLVTGDFNVDGRTDLIVSAPGASAGIGKIYFFETRENFSWTTHPSGLPGTMNTSPGAGQEVRIVGEGGQSGYNFGGYSMVTGDFDADGKADLAVGTPYYSSEGTPNGRVYIFYDDGSIPSSASSADAVITGSLNLSYDFLGWNMSAGDMNGDGKIDLIAAGLNDVWIFYNDGSYPDYVSGADFHITGNRGSAGGMVTGDFNADGRTDLAVGDQGGGTNGRVCIFLFDGSTPTTLDTADIILSGETTDGLRFGSVLEADDFNADGRKDLAVADIYYNGGSNGRVYLFYNGSITTKNASAANEIIVTTNSNGYFGRTMASGDFNADGRMDLAVGEGCFHTNWADGCAYVFFNDGSYPDDVDSADVTIHGSTTSDNFGNTGMTSGDFNGDGKIDLAVTSVLGVNIFFNDGSYPADDSLADIRIAPTSSSGMYFGISLVSADFNADGRTDIAIGDGSVTVNGYADTGAVSIYTFNDSITTGSAGSLFGSTLSSGDFNADGRMDLAVGAPAYSSDTGRVYLFYNDGSVSTSVTDADSVITGNATGDKFGSILLAGDFNVDGKWDLLIGAKEYSFGTGRAYIFHQNTGGGFNASIAASSANSTITGGGGDQGLKSFAAGDFDTDGKTDIAIGSGGYPGNDGKVYIFYQNTGGGFDASIAASAADSIITGETGDLFGNALVSSDFNADGKTDLAVGAIAYSNYRGRVYIFDQDSSGGYAAAIAASSADAIIVGENDGDCFGGGSDSIGMAAGDFNSDGKTDLAVGAHAWGSYRGRTYVFYQNTGGGYIVSLASAADVKIDGGSLPFFGLTLASGDLNADGKPDLIVGTYDYNKSITAVFYNDGSYVNDANLADNIIVGSSTETQSEAISFVIGDFNADGKTDLAVGADNYNSNQGHVTIIITEARASNPTGEAVRSRGPVRTRGQVRIR
jgi:hypothetical protein